MKTAQRTRVLVLEFAAGAPADGLYERYVKLPNFLGVMSQSVAVWAEELGADVTYRTWTGAESVRALLDGTWDVAFVSAYTRAAYPAYAVASVLRHRGAITALGGPHAVAYPGDALSYFDYVCGQTDREIVRTILEERAPAATGCGRWLAAERPPARLPSLRARARFLDAALAKAHFIRVVPLLASVGCPFSCDFCSDARVGYAALPLEDVAADVEFAVEHYPGALLFWMDPTFGVNLDPLLESVERAARGRHVRFGAETTLSLLSDARTAALARAGCAVLMPGIENWHSYDAKVGAGAQRGTERVRVVADRINAIQRQVPYVQVNFVFGLDGAPDEETFDLTRAFVRRAPGVWPTLNLATSWGTASPMSARLHAEGRVLPVPLCLLDQKSCSNVVRTMGSHLDLIRGYARVEDEALGARASLRRAAAASGWATRLVNAARAHGSEMTRRRRWHRTLLRALERDAGTRAFFEGERVRVPQVLRERALRTVGPFAPFLPRAIDDELRLGERRVFELRGPGAAPSLSMQAPIGSGAR